MFNVLNIFPLGWGRNMSKDLALLVEFWISKAVLKGSWRDITWKALG